MNPIPRMHPRAWMVIPICALALLVWTDLTRAHRVGSVSSLAGRLPTAAVADANSPTGYVRGQREVIVPERSESSFDWIAQTQQMLARNEWRVHWVDYDNAPFGREVSAPSPYRWWLGAVAWLDHLLSGRPAGLSAERAALLADPLLHALALVGTALFVAWRFGVFAASLTAVGLVSMFPFAAAFLPGAPDARGLASLCALGSTLVLLAGLNVSGAARAQSARRWFALAGMAGGLGLWVSVPAQAPILAGVLLGALLGTWRGRLSGPVDPAANPPSPPWRAWGIGGAVTVLAAFLAENFPARLGVWRLDAVHPLYGIAWLGAAELLARIPAGPLRERRQMAWRDFLIVGLAIVAVAALPVDMWRTGDAGFLARDLLWARLTSLPDGQTAGSLGAWLHRDGLPPAVGATLLPLLAAALALWCLARRTTGRSQRLSLAVAMGPVLIAFAIALQQLSWWTFLDSAVLALVVAAAAAPMAKESVSPRWPWVLVVMAFGVTGLVQLWPARLVGAGNTLTTFESEELIERHLAHWLATQAGEPGAVVFAPPHLTATLCFYGGLRGIGTFAVDNRAGFGTTLAIAGVTTMEEVQALLRGRGVRYVVIPSWDPFFDEFAQLYLARKFSNRTSFFARELRAWNLPTWLRPIPYQLPVSGGFAGQSVLVFAVVDEQSPVVALSRLAEYFVEVGDLEHAVAAGESLRRFPGDVGALVARAQVQVARDDRAGLAQTAEVLQSRLSTGADRYLPWDRRVSLAMVLVRTNRVDDAREQVRRCLADLTEAKLRSLTTGSLYGLQVLAKALRLEIADPRLRALAAELLPADLRENL